ncbi:MAG TPA: transporter, partial [Nitrospira sp.]
IPFVIVTSNCGVTLVSGVPLQTGGLCASTSSGKFPTRVTNSGLGDLLLTGRYYLVNETDLLPSLMISARVKAPTADSNKGLGTGEWDEGFGVGLTKRFTDNLIAFLDAGYTFIGNPPGAELRNQWSYDAGVGYYVFPTVLVSVSYEEARALVSGFQNPRDILGVVSWKITPAIRLNTSLELGLSNGAPEYGVSLGGSLRF